MQDVASGDIICFDTGGRPGGNYGLLGGHSYTFTGVTTSNGVDYANFRNPWGYENPAPIPVSDLYNAFFDMDVGFYTSAPIAGMTTVSVVENTPVALGIAAPSDPNYAASALTITVTSLPNNGTVTLADGTTAISAGETLSIAQLTGLLFGPAPSAFNSSSTLVYAVEDPAGNIATGTATLSIAPTADSPTVSSANVAASENTAAALCLSAPNDPNYAPSDLTITVTGLPSNGEVTLADGSTVTSGETLSISQLTGLLFNPTPHLFDASSTFSYTVTDPATRSTVGYRNPLHWSSYRQSGRRLRDYSGHRERASTPWPRGAQ